MIDLIVKEGFMRENDKRIAIIVKTIEDVLPALQKAPEEKFDPSSKWI